MKWPQLVLPAACRVPAVVRLTDGADENGAPAELEPIEALCSFDERQRHTVDAERRATVLEGTLYFPGDIAPGVQRLTGTVEIAGRRWDICRGSRGRNPDGSVNFTKLELM